MSALKMTSSAQAGRAAASAQRMDRRGFVIGAGAAVAAATAPGIALAAAGPRRFTLFRGDEEVGYHTLSARKSGEDLTVDIRILIEVRRLGIRFYVYEHQNREIWRNGKLISLASETNDDGDKDFCKITRKTDALRVAGSKYSGDLPADARPSTYWNYGNLSASPWFSSQSGEALDVKLRKDREGALERWSVTGDFSTTLLYDDKKEWRGCRFDAKGTPMVYRQDAAGPAFQALI